MPDDSGPEKSRAVACGPYWTAIIVTVAVASGKGARNRQAVERETAVSDGRVTAADPSVAISRVRRRWRRGHVGLGVGAAATAPGAHARGSQGASLVVGGLGAEIAPTAAPEAAGTEVVDVVVVLGDVEAVPAVPVAGAGADGALTAN